MQVALESHQGFIFACEGDPGAGQRTRACRSVRFRSSCLCYTSVKINKVAALPFFFSFCKKLFFLHFHQRRSAERLAIWKSLAISLSKLQFTAKMANSLSDGIWYPGCALHSKLLCCLPSKLMPTNFEWPSPQQRSVPVFLLSKKKKKDKKIDCFERKHVATMCTRMHGHAAGW